MPIRVRGAGPNDAPGITRVHASEISAWTRIASDGRREPAQYDALSPAERWRHGGPWMDPGLCARHLADLEASGQRAWVAEEPDTGRLLGELETLTGPDPADARVAAIDVLVVLSGHRRAGVGRALVERAVQEAKRGGARRVVAVADPGAAEFYRRIGFETANGPVRDAELTAVEGPTAGGRPFRSVPFPPSFDALEHRSLVLGGFPPSFAVWWKRRWPVPGLTDALAVEEAEMAEWEAFYRLERWPLDPGTLNLLGWVGRRDSTVPLLRHAAARARALGFARLGTMLYSPGSAFPEGLGVRTEAEFPILVRRPE